ncbi:MAG: hypothetical protein N2322_05770, partial [Terrimicrobiaceae bacterium]|nr:hypothetical protein [Terrimicrobiaceae bacterium]
MNASLAKSLDPRAAEPDFEKVQRAEIDHSARVPVLLFFGSGLFWLLLGSALGLLASFKMNIPWLLDGEAWLTFGRIRPAHLNTCLLYTS